MILSFLITVREAMEAALIIGIIAAYLSKIGRKDLNKYLYIGAGTAIAASIATGITFLTIYGGLDDRDGQIFEGIATLSAACVLTYMIFWMSKHAQNMGAELQEKVDTAISKGTLIGISIAAFTSVFREGVETALFLGAVAITAPGDVLLGSIAGLATVIFLSVLTFKSVYKLDLRKFFKYTSILLIIFAAGLTAYGVHELNEAGVIPPIMEVWDINPPTNPDGSYPLLHEKGIIGSLLKSLLGYNGNPSLTEMAAYLGYWLIVGSYIFKIYKAKPDTAAM